MTDRRRAVFVVSAGLIAAWLLQPMAAFADQAFQRFLPLFVDLDGWQGKKPDGMTMETPGNAMTSATRDYTRGSSQFHASVVTGAAAAGAMAPMKAGMTYETTEGHMITATTNGFPTMKTYNTALKSGAFLVELSPTALLSISYNGITEDEAMPLAQKFDWKAFQAAAQQK
jgi:hypothetical protein